MASKRPFRIYRHPKAREEWDEILLEYGSRSKQVLGELTAGVGALAERGSHPSQFPQRGALKAFPVSVWPDDVVYVFFAESDGPGFVVLHLVKVGGQHPTPAGSSAPITPEVPPDSWILAKSRLETEGGW